MLRDKLRSISVDERERFYRVVDRRDYARLPWDVQNVLNAYIRTLLSTYVGKFPKYAVDDINKRASDARMVGSPIYGWRVTVFRAYWSRTDPGSIDFEIWAERETYAPKAREALAGIDMSRVGEITEQMYNRFVTNAAGMVNPLFAALKGAKVDMVVIDDPVDAQRYTHATIDTMGQKPRKKRRKAKKGRK